MNTKDFNNLIRRISQKDKAALEVIYKEYGATIKLIGYQVTGDRHYAEDVLNEILIELWNKAVTFSYIKSPNVWMYRFAKYIAIDFYRTKIKKHKEVVSIDNLTIEPQSYISVFSEIEFLDKLRDLGDMSREIIIMKIQFDFTFKEIAKHLKTPQGTVAWKYRNAMQRLKEAENKKN